MTGNLYVCGVGNVAFAATFAKSCLDTGYHKPPVYVEDRASGCDFDSLERVLADAYRFERHTGRGGCNALWTDCVKDAYANGYDFCVIANDDVIFPRSGWFESILEVFNKNPHVAMVGIGSDSAWEQEHRHRERWFTDPSFTTESAEHCEVFKERAVKYVHHVAGPCWACKPKLWLDAGGIPEQFFWAFGEVIPCIELRKMGYQSVAVQYPVTINHYGGGAFYDIHSDTERHASFSKRASQYGDEGRMFAEKYGTGHIHLLAQDFDAKLPSMNLPPIKYDLTEIP